MDFEYIPKTHVAEKSGYIVYEERFYSFVEEFNAVGVHWSQPQSLSAFYFLKLLMEGSAARARGYGKGYNQGSDEYSNQMKDFYLPLFDHGALWKLKNGSVICTAMPYGTVSSIEESFISLINTFQYPAGIKLQFLDGRYRYRPNGDFMIAIYYDSSDEVFDPNCSFEELRRKAIQHSSSGEIRCRKSTNTYIRDRYISEYARRRAKGICQLCEEPAPFNDKNGEPFLEVHHVIPLAEGGNDSLENTVAICPNCHRKMHSLNLEEDVQKLIQVARSVS